MKDSTIYCINHPHTPMVRNDGFNALVTLTKSGPNVSFNVGSGVPVVVFVCNACGYIELYAATKTPYWEPKK
jgi:uncharacterized protein YraI